MIPCAFQPREDRPIVEAPIEEDGAELPAHHLKVAERLLDGEERAPVPRVEPERSDEPVVGEEDREGGEAVGPMGAPLLLRFHDLAATCVLGSTIVRSVVEVDGDIDGVLRDMVADLFAQGEREGASGPPKAEMSEEPAGGAVGAPPSALGTGPMDGGAKDRRPQQEVGRVADRGGAEGPAQGALQEREEPEEGGRADLSVREGPRPPTRPARR